MVQVEVLEEIGLFMTINLHFSPILLIIRADDTKRMVDALTQILRLDNEHAQAVSGMRMSIFACGGCFGVKIVPRVWIC